MDSEWPNRIMTEHLTGMSCSTDSEALLPACKIAWRNSGWPSMPMSQGPGSTEWCLKISIPPKAQASATSPSTSAKTSMPADRSPTPTIWKRMAQSCPAFYGSVPGPPSMAYGSFSRSAALRSASGGKPENYARVLAILTSPLLLKLPIEVIGADLFLMWEEYRLVAEPTYA